MLAVPGDDEVGACRDSGGGGGGLIVIDIARHRAWHRGRPDPVDRFALRPLRPYRPLVVDGRMLLDSA